MRKVFNCLMIGMAFTAFQIASVGADPVKTIGDPTCAPGYPPMADCPNYGTPMAPPLNADGRPMAPPADCGGVPCPTGHDGGPDGHHPPADCGGVPCPTGHDGGPDGPPIDPRSGQPFTKADEAKYEVYAEECKTSGGTISPASLAILTGDGFTPEQVNGLCQMSANDGPPPAPPAP